MKRRKLLATAAAIGSVSTAGCLEAAELVTDQIEERSGPDPTVSEDEINIEQNNNQLTVTAIKADTATNIKLEQNQETIRETVPSEFPTQATFEIFDLSNSPVEADFEHGQITVVIEGDDVDTLGTKDTPYSPELTLSNMELAPSANYNTSEAPLEATPVLKIENTGTGPTIIESINISNPENTIDTTPSESPSATFVRDGDYKPNTNSRLSPHRFESQYAQLLPSDTSLEYAINGLFTCNPPTNESDPFDDPPEELKQTFTINLKTNLGRTYSYEATVQFRGGITHSGSEEDTWTHHYQSAYIQSIDEADF